jgi:bifunctional non-homologous end joining protein LigD
MSSKLKSPRRAKPSEETGSVRLTNPDRVLYAQQGITKRDLANYYVEIADWILPHIAGRPLAFVRCPTGMNGDCFYQKHPPQGLPAVVERIQIREKSEFDTYVVVHDIEGIVALVQFGTLELHAWGSKSDNVERPDRMVFDLDPDVGLPWKRVVEAAFQLRDLLAELGLRSFVKTTGGKGLHLVLPLVRKHTWQEIKQFSKAVADTLATIEPRRYVANMSKAARQGKIFIDYLRNERGATAVAAYSSRAKDGAPVSAPLTWDELSAISQSDVFSVQSMPKRLRRLRQDPWKDISHIRQSITAAAKRKLGVR